MINLKVYKVSIYRQSPVKSPDIKTEGGQKNALLRRANIKK